MTEDSYVHIGKRRKMIEALVQQGIKNKSVLESMFQVPRHIFMDSALEDHAYELKAFPIAANQTISSPLTVAFQSQELQPEKGMKVLEIGTGSGYQCAILVRLGMQVFTIERQEELFVYSQNMLQKLDAIPELQILGDGYIGLRQFAPFHRILVTASAPEIPVPLTEQLAPGGVMIIPLGDTNQQMHRITKDLDGNIHDEIIGKAAFVPMLKDVAYGKS